MKAEAKDGIISLVIGVLILAALILFGYFGATSQNSVLNGVAFILLLLLGWPLFMFYHDREAPIVVLAALAIFDVIIISGFVFVLRTWLRSRGRMRLPHAETDSDL
jgi:hypothetical protein